MDEWTQDFLLRAVCALHGNAAGPATCYVCRLPAESQRNQRSRQSQRSSVHYARFRIRPDKVCTFVDCTRSLRATADQRMARLSRKAQLFCLFAREGGLPADVVGEVVSALASLAADPLILGGYLADVAEWVHVLCAPCAAGVCKG